VRIVDEEEFEQLVADALARLPREFANRMDNVAVIVEDEPPPGSRLLGLYEGVPLPRRHYYSQAYPDRITIFRGPLERLYGHDRERLRAEVGRVVLHEVAHHFGISDERLIELDRY
jgi:predicted Zn-dependent protease with MMP-like domain